MPSASLRWCAVVSQIRFTAGSFAAAASFVAWSKSASIVAIRAFVAWSSCAACSARRGIGCAALLFRFRFGPGGEVSG